MVVTKSLPAQLLAAVMLGVGALLQTKRHKDDHWSLRPTVEVVSENDGHSAGAPPSET